MCQSSPVRIAYCDNIRSRQTKAKPDPQAMRDLIRILGDYGAEGYDLIQRYLKGTLSIEAVQSLFEQIAQKHHSSAHHLGQEVAGTPRQGLATARGRQISLIEGNFFRGFLAALQDRDPRYFREGVPRDDQIARRVGQYLPKAEGSAIAGFAQNHAPGQRFDWLLGAGDHCNECPTLADMGPYYRETLPFYPREGYTPCRSNCKCSVQTIEGEGSFDPAEYDLVSALGLADAA